VEAEVDRQNIPPKFRGFQIDLSREVALALHSCGQLLWHSQFANHDLSLIALNNPTAASTSSAFLTYLSTSTTIADATPHLRHGDHGRQTTP
jgi:hypothetical protein